MSDENLFGEFIAYVGDGLYMHFDGYQIWLVTQQGISIAIHTVVFRLILNSINENEKLKEYKELLERHSVRDDEYR